MISYPDPVPGGNATQPLVEDPRSGLDALLAQVNALAIRLRQPATASGHLPAAEYSVLDILHTAGPMTVPDIARERSTSRQNIQILVDKLEAGKRVETVPNPAHKRSDLVRLTSEGNRWLMANEPEYRRFLSEIEAELGQNEIQSGLSVLRRIHQLLTKKAAGEESKSSAKRGASLAKRSSENERKVASDPAAEEEFPLNLL